MSSDDNAQTQSSFADTFPLLFHTNTQGESEQEETAALLGQNCSHVFVGDAGYESLRKRQEKDESQNKQKVCVVCDDLVVHPLLFGLAC